MISRGNRSPRLHWSCSTDMQALNDLADDALLDRLQRAAFNYLAEYSNAENGLVADTSRAGSPCSIAVVGFALSCYPIAVDRGWMSRTDVRAEVDEIGVVVQRSRVRDPETIH